MGIGEIAETEEIEEIIGCEGYTEYNDMWFGGETFREIVIYGFTKERKTFLMQEYFCVGRNGYLTAQGQVSPNGQPLGLIRNLARKRMQSSVQGRSSLELIDWLAKQENEKIKAKK